MPFHAPVIIAYLGICAFFFGMLDGRRCPFRSPLNREVEKKREKKRRKENEKKITTQPCRLILPMALIQTHNASARDRLGARLKIYQAAEDQGSPVRPCGWFLAGSSRHIMHSVAPTSSDLFSSGVLSIEIEPWVIDIIHTCPVLSPSCFFDIVSRFWNYTASPFASFSSLSW